MYAEATVFVVDDDPAVRTSVRHLTDTVSLPSQAYGSAKEFLDNYDPAMPGCLVLDLRMPGMSGLELQKQLAASAPAIPVIMITGHGDISTAVDALQHGAMDFMEKPIHPQTLLDRIQQALRQDRERRRTAAGRNAIKARLATLTPREHQVVQLAAEGLTNKQIAAQLGVSSQAIDAHRMKAMSKMQAGSVPALVRLMLEAGNT